MTKLISERGFNTKSVERDQWDLKCVTWEFFLNVSLNSLNSVTKIFVITVKGLEPATQLPLVERPGCYHSASNT